MLNWLQNILQKLSKLPDQSLPASQVFRQIIKGIVDERSRLTNEYVRIPAERRLLEREILHTLSYGEIKAEEFFQETNKHACLWKTLLIRERIILLVYGKYMKPNLHLERYKALAIAFNDSNGINDALLQKFKEEFRNTIWFIEPEGGKFIRDLAAKVQTAIDKGDAKLIYTELTRLLIPEKDIREVIQLLSISSLELFKNEMARKEDEAKNTLTQEEAMIWLLSRGRPPRNNAKLKKSEADEAEIESVSNAPQLSAQFNAKSSESDINKGSSPEPMLESNIPEQKARRDTVFISYSHDDVRWLKMLKIHLKPFERKGLIKRWDDTEIKPGQIWKNEIEKAIQTAKVVVLLVSPAFLASDFIAKNELPPLLQGAETDGAIILSVVIKPCSYTQTEEIAKYQAVNAPNKTLAKLKTAERDEVLSLLTKRILEIFEEA